MTSTPTWPAPPVAPTQGIPDPDPSTAGMWRVVAAREVAVKLRDRNFLVSTALLLILLVLSLGLQVVLAKQAGSTSVAVASQSATSIVKQASSSAKASGDAITFKAERLGSTAAVERAVREGKADAGLVSIDKGWRLVGKEDRNSAISSWVTRTVQQSTMQRNAEAAGTNLGALTRGSSVSYDLLVPAKDRHPSARLAGSVFGLLFYIAALVFGGAIANSVVEEKQNRVVEILASAIPIRQLLVGKVLGNTLLALAQVLLIAAIGTIGLLATGKSHLVSQIAGGSGWFIVFFLVGFIALACLWAVVGALATRIEDIQSTSPPMTVMVMVIFFVGILASGTVLKVVSFLPLLATIAMPSRVISGDATWWQALIALGTSVIGAWLIIRVAERMYRNSLMQTNRRMTFREAFNRKGHETTPATPSQ